MAASCSSSSWDGRRCHCRYPHFACPCLALVFRRVSTESLDGFPTGGMAGSNIQELPSCSRALVPQLEDKILGGCPRQEGAHNVSFNDVRQLVALPREAPNILSEGFTRFLLTVLQVPGVARAGICPLEVADENVPQDGPSVDQVRGKVLKIVHVESTRYSGRLRMMGPSRMACKAVILWRKAGIRNCRRRTETLGKTAPRIRELKTHGPEGLGLRLLSSSSSYHPPRRGWQKHSLWPSASARRRASRLERASRVAPILE